MRTGSFYETTERHSVDEGSWEVAKRSYAYNFNRFLPLDKTAKIVDLGCSEGIALDWLQGLGYVNIVGIDSDEVALKEAKKKLRQLNDNNLLCIDALKYLQECEDSSVDFIMMMNVIEHIPKSVIVDIMAEVKRVLKANGAFLAQTGNWENPLNIGLFTRDFTHEVLYTKNSLKQMMMYNFSLEQIETGVLRYEPSLKNLVRGFLSSLCCWLVKKIAWCMRIYIREMSPMIYCLVKK